MEDVNLISRGLYGIVSRKLGTESIVDMRRRVMALQQRLITARARNSEVFEDIIFSGSKCEGFRFASSDDDWMFICRNVRVVHSTSQQDQYHSRHTILMAQCEFTKPGFVLLKLASDCSVPRVGRACVQYGDGYYVSSEKWRENITALSSSFTTHGPCSTAVFGNTEVDHALCFKSGQLPKRAHGFVRRLQKCGWPSASTLLNIVSDGCLFVAIGSKESFTEPLEWRISFSIAEKKLIHSMNHVQFLCYGLLKRFLKEAIDSNVEIKGLLCSYFLKTTLFWEISYGRLQWNASDLLNGFWVCIQRLLHWIHNEYCPNFFIPENNMFAGKIYGQTRVQILAHFMPIFSEGYQCFLRCPSIRMELHTLLQQPLLGIQMEQMAVSDKCEEECELIREVWTRSPPSNFTEAIKIYHLLEDLELLISENEVPMNHSILGIWRRYIFQNAVICSSCTLNLENKEANKTRQLHVNMVTNIHVDTTRHLLYAAVYYYRSGMYRTVLRLIDVAQRKLQHPQLLYPWHLRTDKYRAAGGDRKPFEHLMTEIVAWPIELEQNINVPELIPEHHSASKIWLIDQIVIPPLVLVHFLSFLCHYHMQNIHLATSVLHDLYTLLHYDDGYHISERDRAISWQMLGICQEMSGNFQGAYQSYSKALQQNWCHIRYACVLRIQNLARLE